MTVAPPAPLSDKQQKTSSETSRRNLQINLQKSIDNRYQVCYTCNSGGDKMSQIWYLKVKKKLIDMNMSQKQLAENIGVNYSVLCSVLNGKTIRKPVKEKICDYLKI